MVIFVNKSINQSKPSRVKFNIQTYFNPTKRNLKKKKLGSPAWTLSLCACGRPTTTKLYENLKLSI